MGDAITMFRPPYAGLVFFGRGVVAWAWGEPRRTMFLGSPTGRQAFGAPRRGELRVNLGELGECKIGWRIELVTKHGSVLFESMWSLHDPLKMWVITQN